MKTQRKKTIALLTAVMIAGHVFGLSWNTSSGAQTASSDRHEQFDPMTGDKTTAYGSVHAEWVRHYSSGFHPGGDGVVDMLLDPFGNTILAGNSQGEEFGSSIVIIKYDSMGTEQWVVRNDGCASNETAADAALGPDGEVVVVGSRYDSSSGYDYLTVKYDTDGNFVWEALYNGPTNFDDGAAAVEVDDSGHVTVTGSSMYQEEGYSNIVTMQYDPEGNPIWSSRYQDLETEWDNQSAQYLALDRSGNAIVEGTIWPNLARYLTIKYGPGGTEQWVNTASSGDNLSPAPVGMVLDTLGNITVAGRLDAGPHYYNYLVFKINPQGERQNQGIYDSGGDDFATGLLVDNRLYTTVTGYSERHRDDEQGDQIHHWNIVTIQFDTSFTPLWTTEYDGPDSLDDCARAITCDGNGNIYVTGSSVTSEPATDFVTTKYDTAGVEMWNVRLGGPGHGDTPSKIAVDGSGNVFVAGTSLSANGYAMMTLVKYVQTFDTGITGKIDALPRSPALLQNFPNPFNSETRIFFELKRTGRVELSIVDVSGRTVRTLLDRTEQSGNHSVFWDGMDNDGTAVFSGLYLCVLRSEGFKDVKKMVMIR